MGGVCLLIAFIHIVSSEWEASSDVFESRNLTTGKVTLSSIDRRTGKVADRVRRMRGPGTEAYLVVQGKPASFSSKILITLSNSTLSSDVSYRHNIKSIRHEGRFHVAEANDALDVLDLLHQMEQDKEIHAAAPLLRRQRKKKGSVRLRERLDQLQLAMAQTSPSDAVATITAATRQPSATRSANARALPPPPRGSRTRGGESAN